MSSCLLSQVLNGCSHRNVRVVREESTVPRRKYFGNSLPCAVAKALLVSTRNMVSPIIEEMEQINTLKCEWKVCYFFYFLVRHRQGGFKISKIQVQYAP